MLRRHTQFSLLYLFIFALNVYALVTDNQLLRMIAMPSIGMSLVFYLILRTRIEDNFQKLIFIGLVLSMAGDIQLLFTTGTEFYFLTALIATFLGYLLYALAYWIDVRKDLNKTKAIGNSLIVVLLITLPTFYITARRNLEGFVIPVIVYLLALSVMVVLAGYRHKRVNRPSFKLILTGSFAFIVSDVCIGYYTFIEPDEIMMVVYLSAYLISQYLVVMGTIARKDRKVVE